MKKFFIYTLLVAFVATFTFTGCKEDTGGEEAGAFETMTTYMAQNGMDLDDVLAGWITARPETIDDVPAFVANNTIFDFRSATDYAAGHIEGAINVTYDNLLAKAAEATNPIIVVCYTGQSAGHAVVALRLSGYTDAKVLKFGMAGWSSDNSAPWLGNSGNDNGVIGVGHANWSDAATKSVATFDVPIISTTATDGATILAERVDAMLAGKFKGVTSATVLENPGNYFINNYWAAEDTEHYGHIVDAYRIKPMTIEGGQLANLDPSATICTYCWTGQTSSMVTAYLNVLGYNAVSLKFGSNSMIYSELESHKFTAPTVDYPVE